MRPSDSEGRNDIARPRRILDVELCGMTARVRLIRKLAEAIDGVDLSTARVGDVLELEEVEAELLTAEGWAVRIEAAAPRRALTRELARAANATRRTREHRERIRTHIDDPTAEPRHLRRVEDRLREELHDDRARIIQNIAHSIGAVADTRAPLDRLAPDGRRKDRQP